MQDIFDISSMQCYSSLNSIWKMPKAEGKEAPYFMKNLKPKLARMEKDISQTELAKRVGVTRQTIGMVESGDYNPTLNLCIQICKELGKTLNDLFWEEEQIE